MPVDPTIEQALAALEPEPCPFCEQAKAVSLRSSPAGRTFYVECYCHARGPKETTGSGAIAAWNRRAALTASPAAPSDEETGKLVGRLRLTARLGEVEQERGEWKTAEADPDLGKIGPGHVCKHGIRWPHACDECDRAAYIPAPAPDLDALKEAVQAVISFDISTMLLNAVRAADKLEVEIERGMISPRYEFDTLIAWRERTEAAQSSMDAAIPALRNALGSGQS